MARSIKLEKDDGFIQVEVDSGEIVQLDLFRSQNVYAQLCEEHPDAALRAEAWVAWLEGEGLPKLSHGASFVLAGEINKEVDAFKKKAGSIWEMPGSADSTDSPSST